MSQTDVPTPSPITNSTQVQVGGASIIALIAGYAAGQGWLSLSLSDWTTIITAIVAVGSILVPIIKTRALSLKSAVGNMDHTTVVTDAASAAALPKNKDVVAVTPAIAEAIKKAS